MSELAIERFAVVGHDTGYVISYALAADHRDRVDGWPWQKSLGLPGAGDPTIPRRRRCSFPSP